MRIVERHKISKKHRLYVECSRVSFLSFLSKNLYNAGLYAVRQSFFSDEESYKNYETLQKEFQNSDQKDYRSLPSKISQHVLKQVNKDFKSFFEATRVYRKAPQKFLGKPKIPKYKDKVKGRNLLVYTIQAISKTKLKVGTIKLSQTTIEFPTKVKAEQIQQVRVVPRNGYYVIEVVYERAEKPEKLDNQRYAGIDIGVNNLATMVTNCGDKPLIINGKPLKSMNQYYNQKRAKLQSKSKIGKSRRLEKLTNKRNNKVEDYLHKASREITTQIVSKGITKVVIGKNPNWKQEVTIGRVNNQNFVQIPHAELINKLTYKCELEGIEVIIQEESYTSICSFLDNEAVQKQEKYCGTRVTRGLFKSAKGTKINADVNGAGNILRKAIPHAFKAEGIEGVVVRPLRLAL